MNTGLRSLSIFTLPGRRMQEGIAYTALSSPQTKEIPMSYIDGFVIAVPTANKQKFIDHARHFDSMFLELGAIRVIEGWGDDVPDGKVTDFQPRGAGHGR